MKRTACLVVGVAIGMAGVVAFNSDWQSNAISGLSNLARKLEQREIDRLANRVGNLNWEANSINQEISDLKSLIAQAPNSPLVEGYQNRIEDLKARKVATASNKGNQIAAIEQIAESNRQVLDHQSERLAYNPPVSTTVVINQTGEPGQETELANGNEIETSAEHAPTLVTTGKPATELESEIRSNGTKPCRRTTVVVYQIKPARSNCR